MGGVFSQLYANPESIQIQGKERQPTRVILDGQEEAPSTSPPPAGGKDQKPRRGIFERFGLKRKSYQMPVFGDVEEGAPAPPSDLSGGLAGQPASGRVEQPINDRPSTARRPLQAAPPSMFKDTTLPTPLAENLDYSRAEMEARRRMGDEFEVPESRIPELNKVNQFAYLEDSALDEVGEEKEEEPAQEFMISVHDWATGKRQRITMEIDADALEEITAAGFKVDGKSIKNSQGFTLTSDELETLEDIINPQ